MGWKDNPLRVGEAIQWLKSQNRSASLKIESPHPAPSLQVKKQDIMVEMEKVCFSYNGSQVLQDIDLTLMRGECIALLGRNGSGKTTLIKHLNGLLKPKQGKVITLSQDTRKTPVAKLARHVGFVWQNPNDQLFQATVREEILTGPRVLHVYDRNWCDVLFDRFQLGPLLDRSPFRLSEGQKKRVSFASALAVQPELIVLDEPTAGQDDSFRKELALLIKELQTEGRTVVLVTHDIEFAAEHASRWMVLNEGKLMADGSPEEIMKNPSLMMRAGLKPTQEFQLRQEIEKAFREESDDRSIP
jgi:energy-coupling factor transport system ATP-binding protein